MAENYIIDNVDVIEGKMGSCMIKIAGENIPVAWLKNISAVMYKQKKEFPRLGTTAMGHRSSGWVGKGKASMYYAVSMFRQMAQEYAKTGKDIYVEMVITNEDPTSSVGEQSVMLYNVNFDQVVLAGLDIDSNDPLDETIDFTFDGFTYMKVFTHPAIPNGLKFG